jgi:hypothetical protein
MHLIACEAGVKRRNILLALEAGFAAVGILTGEHSLDIGIPTALVLFFPRA